ncbi:MAG: response regulator [Lutibacter sp.]|nr:response regulator [Lutibacter sp.]
METLLKTNNNILIVDDNPKNLQVLGKLLQYENFEVEFAIDGQSALDWMEAKNFDLMLLDINMPVISGFDVCEKIRSNPKFDKIPIIFLTADIDRESILKGFELGAQDYVTKPFDSRELIMRVKTHLSLKNSREKLEELNLSLEEKVKERTAELLIAKEKAEESNRLKTVFLNNLSHELRTPMNGILGFINLLKKPELGEEKKEKYIEIVNISAERLLDTMDELVLMSKIEAGDNMLHITSFDLNQEMHFQFAFFKPKADKKEIQLLCSNQIESNDAIIKSDKIKIASILTNLINNAIKFTNKGKVEFGNYIESGNLVLFVKDTGVGIPANKFEAIFERFVQADTRSTREHDGLGLGLSITKAYVDALGGIIETESKENQGSIFRVKIPNNKQ